MDYDRSTGAGQKRMFYEAHRRTADTMHEKASMLAFESGEKDGAAGVTPRTPGNDDYMRGYRAGKST